jgi:hypothetical protein
MPQRHDLERAVPLEDNWRLRKQVAAQREDVERGARLLRCNQLALRLIEAQSVVAALMIDDRNQGFRLLERRAQLPAHVEAAEIARADERQDNLRLADKRLEVTSYVTYVTSRV